MQRDGREMVMKALKLGCAILFLSAFFHAAPAFAAAPPVVTGTATDVTGSSANLGYQVDPDGSTPDLGLSEEGAQYAKESYYLSHDNGYNHTSRLSPPDYQNSGHGGSFGADFLSCGTTYHFRAYVITNDDERGYGEDATFTTSDCAPGDGSAENPYRIGTCADLQAMNENLDAHYILADTIDCSMTNPDDDDFDAGGTWGDGHGFIPIGTGDTPFTGYLEGDGNTISNLYISNTGPAGLFGYLLGGAGNLTLSDEDITGSNNVGALAGQTNSDASINSVHVEDGTVNGAWYVGGLVGLNEGTITGGSSSATVSATSYTGGLVGQDSDGGTIEGSSATGSVQVTDNGIYVGGLVGYQDGGTIFDSYSTADIDGTQTGETIGGFAGFSNGTIRRSYASGSVIGGTTIGGFIGRLDDGALIVDSHSRGDVEGYGSKIGGFVGSNAGTIETSYSASAVHGAGTVDERFSVGGFAGDQDSTVSGSFEAGLVTVEDGYGQVGGFAGYEDGTSPDSGWWTGAYTQAFGIGSTPLAYGEHNHNNFKDKSIPFYADWDFTDTPVWDIDESEDYPKVNAGWPYLHALSSSYISEEDDVDDSGDSGEDLDGEDSGGGDDGPTPFAGSGTEEDPYIIDDCSLFPEINDHLDAFYLMTQDLDCRDLDEDVMVGGFFGEGGDPFSGTFDGGGHTIDVVIIEPETPAVGLFRGVIGGTIKNLTIGSDSLVVGQVTTGSVVGAEVDSTITSVNSFAHVVVTGTIAEFPFAGGGGIVGGMYGGTLTDAHFFGEVYGSFGVGGITGLMLNDLSTGPGAIIERSSNHGSVHSELDSGGIVSYMLAGAQIRNSFNVGDIVYDTDFDEPAPGGLSGGFGGIAGLMQGAIISRSYSAGSVQAGESESPSGGLIGAMFEDDDTVVDSFSATAMTGSAPLGAFVGLEQDGPDTSFTGFFNNFYDTARTGIATCSSDDTMPREDCTGVDGSATGFWQNSHRQPFQFWNKDVVWDFGGEGEYPNLQEYDGPGPEESDDRAELDSDDDGGGDEGGDDTPPDVEVPAHHAGGSHSKAGRQIVLPFHDMKTDIDLKGKGVVSVSTTAISIGTTTAPSIVGPYPLRDLQAGATGEDVKALQAWLIARATGAKAAALAAFGPTGYFGPATRAALAEYQAAHAIAPAAGYFGPLTRSAMKAALQPGLWW